MTSIHEDQDKHTSCTTRHPDENIRKTTIKSSRRKYENSSSSESDTSHTKYYHQYTSKLKRKLSNLNHLKTKLLKIYHLPSKMSNQSIDGIRLKYESYHDLMKRSVCSDNDIDEYSIKATRTLYIGNLQSDISYNELREIYSIYGDIIEVEIKRQQQQQTFAFIQYADIKSVVRAMKTSQSKLIHNHSIKLGFGKSQPTNILWLDNLPSNITESILRSFINRITNLSSNKILDIYIDNRNYQKTHCVQCLIYFIDIMTAQNAINSIRGKKIQSNRIQTDFASKVFLTRFSDIIQQKNSKKNSSQLSNYNSKIFKSAIDKNVNSEQISNESNKISFNNLNSHNLFKKNFQTKIIPLQTDSSFIQSDIRLKIYSSLSNQSINSIYLPFPKFANTLIKLENIPMIFKSFELKKNLSEQKIINTNIFNEDLLIENKLCFSSSVLSHSSNSLLTNSTNIPASKYNSISSSINQLSPSIYNDKLTIDLLSPLSNTNNNLSINSLERLDSSTKFKHKSIPPPLSIITTLPTSSNTNDSPIFPTPTSIIENQNSSPILQKSMANHSPKSLILKSILKQSVSNKTVHIISTNSSFTPTIKSLDDKKKLLNQQNNNIITNNLSNQSITLINNKKTLLGKIPKKSNIKIIKQTPILSFNTNVSKSIIKHVNLKSSHEINQIDNIEKVNKNSSLQTKKFLLNTENLKYKQQYQNDKISLSTIKQNLTSKSLINMKKSQEKLITKSNNNNKINKKTINEISKNNLTLKQNASMYDRIKKRSRNEPNRNNLLLTKNDYSSDGNNDDNISLTNNKRLKRHVIIDSSESENDISTKIEKKKAIVIDSNIFDTEENDDKKKIFKTNSLQQKRRLTDKSNKFSKKLKLKSNVFSSIKKEQTIESKISLSKISSNNTSIENTLINKVDTVSLNHYDHQSISENNKEGLILEINETTPQDNLININQYEHIESISSSLRNKTQLILNENEQKPNELSSHILSNKSTENLSNQEISKLSQCSSITSLNETIEETLNAINHSLIHNTNAIKLPSDYQAVITDTSVPTSSSNITKYSSFPSSITDDILNLFDPRLVNNYKHASILTHLFSQPFIPDNNLYTPHQQYFLYQLFSPSPDSSPLSTSSCSSVTINPFYNTITSEYQHCHNKESRGDSKCPITSSDHSTQHLGSESTSSFQNLTDLYDYTATTQQILNSFANKFYQLNNFQSYDPYNIQWEGHILLKNEQAYIKTQLIAGNPQIARISIDYWNTNLNHNLRVTQRMRLEEIQLDGVQKRLQINNDYCILIAEPNGLTPDEIRLEQNHLKNGLIQYLNEKKAAGIINILLPSVLQPIYIVHIFPPCQFASEILQKRAPDAYRCVVQNKIEQIYLLFIITSTIQ